MSWALALVCLGCSPGRIGAEGSGTSSESGLAPDSESEDGPIVETESDSGDGDGDGPWGGCDGEGSRKYLDICEPRDPCDSTVCEGALECLGGQCVAPKPAQLCQGIALVDDELPVELGLDSGPLLLSNIDGALGDELISAGQGEVEVIRAGELLVSTGLPEGFANALHPMQLDGDPHVDLLVFSERYQDAFTVLLSGDGQGHFEPALLQLPGGAELRSPFPLDFDNDGDHDLVAAYRTTQLYRNDAGALAWLIEFPFDGRLGVASDLDLDGFVDDALFGDYPSPTVLLGEGGQLVEAGTLPEPQRGANLQYGVGRPLAADLDGDGWVEVFSALSDDNGRVGGRIWWGLPGNTFAEPRDQLLENIGWGFYSAAEFVGFVELDGAPPLELLYHTEDRLGYVRPDLANQLPFECFTPLLLEPTQTLSQAPAVGDMDADGRVEIAIRDYHDAEVYTVVAVP